MEEKSLTAERAEIDNFVREKPVLELVDLILSLDKVKPYIELTQNGEVGKYLNQKGLNIVHNRAEFDYFYAALNDRICQLEGKDERATLLLQKNPSLRVAQLERKASIKFEEYKPLIKATMESIWKDCAEQNVQIKNEEERFEIETKSYLNRDEVTINLHFDSQDYCFKLHKRKEIIETPKKVSYGPWGLLKKIEIERKEVISPLKIDYILNGFFREENNKKGFEKGINVSGWKIDEFFDRITKLSLENPENIKKLRDFIKAVLELPQKIDSHFNKLEKGLEEVLEITGETR